MSGRARVQLASVMDLAPGVGLIQTIPTVINSRTLFARWQQFAASAYGTIAGAGLIWRSEEHTSELQSLMRISYAVFCLKKKITTITTTDTVTQIATIGHLTLPLIQSNFHINPQPLHT